MAVRLLLALALLLAVTVGTRAKEQAQASNQDSALLSLRDVVSNWDSALLAAAVPGSPWLNGTNACGSSNATIGSAALAWQGVTCSTDGQVTELALRGLGLAGSLPDELALLPALTLLDLNSNGFQGSVPPAWLQPAAFPSLAVADLSSNLLEGVLAADLLSLASGSISIASNRFDGSLPGGWSSPSLTDLDVSSNRLTGSLPASWAAEGLLPMLASMHMQSNALTGTIPLQWTAGAFAVPATLQLRPGNPGLCGPVMPLDPGLDGQQDLQQSEPQLSAANQAHTGNATSRLILTQADLFTPGTSVIITNWLGMCMLPCSVTGGLAQPPSGVTYEGLSWPPIVQTNVFDISWVFNMSISDLVRLNPDASSLRTGTSLSLPCYSDDESKRFGYHGSDVAYGQFSGGNQLLGLQGFQGAMDASRVNGYLPIGRKLSTAYMGSAGPASGGPVGRQLVEPIYWFVDMLADFQVSTVVVTAGNAVQNASLYIGSNATSVFSNALVGVGLSLAAGQQVALPASGVTGRYVVLYCGLASEGSLSLSNVQVYTFETNAAANKPVSVSSLSGISRGGASFAQQALVDNNVSTCIQLQPDSTSLAGGNTAWAFVDLGYVGTVSLVAVDAGAGITPDMAARVFVTQTADESPSDTSACTIGGLDLRPNSWAACVCNRTGRFVTLSVATPPSAVIDLCELQVSLMEDPLEFHGSNGVDSGTRDGTNNPPSTADSLSISGGRRLGNGSIAGIVLGSLLISALMLLLIIYIRWRQQWLQQQRSAHGKWPSGIHQPQQWGDGPSMHGSEDGAKFPGKQQASSNGAEPEAAYPMYAGAEALETFGGGIVSEMELIRQFSKSIKRQTTVLLVSKSRQETAAERSAKFRMARGATRISAHQATTDLTKVPPGFTDVSPSDIQLIELVGEGSFGEVWLAKYCEAMVAVKLLAKFGSSHLTSSMQHQLLVRNLRKEALLMSNLRHPNVCLYLGACLDPPCLVLEYCTKSSLDVLLKAGLTNTQTASQLPWPRLLGMALDAAKGMLYLHSRMPPVAHRDLKSANLLVDSQWRVKVADFSLSRAVEVNSSASTVMLTNPRWLAPEILQGQPGQLPADVYAFGTVLWELCTWQLPFRDLNTFQIISAVQSQQGGGLHVPVPGELAAGPFASYEQYAALMCACWAIDPIGRPKFDVIVHQLGRILSAEAEACRPVAAPSIHFDHGYEQKTVRAPATGPAYTTMLVRMRLFAAQQAGMGK